MREHRTGDPEPWGQGGPHGRLAFNGSPSSPPTEQKAAERGMRAQRTGVGRVQGPCGLFLCAGGTGSKVPTDRGLRRDRGGGRRVGLCGGREGTGQPDDALDSDRALLIARDTEERNSSISKNRNSFAT